jgi:hypothetical protein
MTVRISQEELDHVIRLVEHDVKATLGTGYEHMIRSMTDALAHLFGENADIEDEDGEVDESWNLEYFIERVVEDVQQWFHDSFTDTTWPRCPRHLRHPLWLIDGIWTCDKDQPAFGNLGELDVPYN